MLKPDEQLILYPSLGRAVSGGWEIQIRGIIYEPERRGILTGALRRALGIDEDKLTAPEKATFKQRSSYFLVDNERGKALSVDLAGQSVSLGTSAANGHFEALAVFKTAQLPVTLAADPADATLIFPGTIATSRGPRELPFAVSLLRDEGLSVISDLDDTIKISNVLNKRALITNTFCRPFVAVPGMADLYKGWAGRGAQFHYLTASPWQLYLPLSEFTRSNGFPAGTFHMKTFRVKDSTFLSLLTSQERYKPGVVEELFGKFPKRRYVLVGDSGEKDPEIYGALARKHPGKILRIFIRDVTDEPATAARYTSAFQQVPSSVWQIFKQPGEIKWQPEP